MAMDGVWDGFLSMYSTTVSILGMGRELSIRLAHCTT